MASWCLFEGRLDMKSTPPTSSYRVSHSCGRSSRSHARNRRSSTVARWGISFLYRGQRTQSIEVRGVAVEQLEVNRRFAGPSSEWDGRYTSGRLRCIALADHRADRYLDGDHRDVTIIDGPARNL